MEVFRVSLDVDMASSTRQATTGKPTLRMSSWRSRQTEHVDRPLRSCKTGSFGFQTHRSPCRLPLYASQRLLMGSGSAPVSSPSFESNGLLLSLGHRGSLSGMPVEA